MKKAWTIVVSKRNETKRNRRTSRTLVGSWDGGGPLRCTPESIAAVVVPPIGAPGAEEEENIPSSPVAPPLGGAVAALPLDRRERFRAIRHARGASDQGKTKAPPCT